MEHWVTLGAYFSTPPFFWPADPIKTYEKAAEFFVCGQRRS